MELGLGTVQFGLDYGLSNEEGKVPAREVCSILKIAHENGIRVLDTAAKYGESESVLSRAMFPGNSFKVFTKLYPLKKDTIGIEDVALLKKKFGESLRKLKLDCLAGLLVHYPGDLLVSGGDVIYDYMLSLKERGYVEKIGVSVYTGEEIDRLFHHYNFDMVQLPMNVFDQRLIHSGHISKLKVKNVEIHVRSAFLQGLLLMPIGIINPYFVPIMPMLKKYRAYLDNNNVSPVEGALGFLRAQPELDVILTGVTNENQLRANIEAFNVRLPSSLDFSQFAVECEDMINPVLWKLT